MRHATLLRWIAGVLMASAFSIFAQVPATVTYSVNGYQSGTADGACAAAAQVSVSQYCGSQLYDYGGGQIGCLSKSTSNGSGTCQTAGLVGYVSSSQSCGAGYTLSGGNCVATATGACAASQGIVVNGFIPGTYDQLNALATTNSTIFGFVQQGGCSYSVTHTGSCVQNGQPGLCVSAIGTGVPPGQTNGGSPNQLTLQPTTSGGSTATSTSSTPAVTSPAQGGGTTGGGTGGTNTGYNTVDSQNLAQVATNTATTKNAIDNASDSNVGAIKELQGVIAGIKAGQCGGPGQPACSVSGQCGGPGQPACNVTSTGGSTGGPTSITGQCGGAGQPACTISDDGAGAAAITEANGLKAQLDTARGNYSDNSVLGYGSLPDLDGGSRFRFSFLPFLSYSGNSDACKIQWQTSVNGVSYTPGIDVCGYLQYVRDFAYWLMAIFTSVSIWSMVYGKSE